LLGLIGWLVTALVVAAVVAGFLLVGSPAQARRERADAQRVSDLESLARAVRDYHAERKALPEQIEQVYARTYRPVAELMDPVTGKAYEYRVVDKGRFELCAIFQTDQSARKRSGPYGWREEGMPFWRHGSGRQCFTLEAKLSAGK
jgi:hypothetical protein